MAAVLKLWSQIKNPTPSFNAYLLEEQSHQISSRSDLKRQSLRLFWRAHPIKKKNNNNIKKMNNDMKSVPELTMLLTTKLLHSTKATGNSHSGSQKFPPLHVKIPETRYENTPYTSRM